ncbi:hypothetical protein GCM10008941_32420 [Rhizomicrobium palustre]
MRDSFKFSLLGAHIQGHGWGIPAAALVAIFFVTAIWFVAKKLSVCELMAVGQSFLHGVSTATTKLSLSSPAECSEQREEQEGKGIQVASQRKSRKQSVTKLQAAEQISPPGSPSLARAQKAAPHHKQLAARARRG